MAKKWSKSGSKSDPKMTPFWPPTGIDFSLMMVKMDPPGGLRPPGGIDFTSMMVKMGSETPRGYRFYVYDGKNRPPGGSILVILGSFGPLKSWFSHYVSDTFWNMSFWNPLPTGPTFFDLGEKRGENVIFPIRLRYFLKHVILDPGGPRPPGGIDFTSMMVKMDPPGGLRPPGGIDFTSMMVKIDPREGRFWSFLGHLDPKIVIFPIRLRYFWNMSFWNPLLCRPTFLTLAKSVHKRGENVIFPIRLRYFLKHVILRGSKSTHFGHFLTQFLTLFSDIYAAPEGKWWF